MFTRCARSPVDRPRPASPVRPATREDPDRRAHRPDDRPTGLCHPRPPVDRSTHHTLGPDLTGRPPGPFSPRSPAVHEPLALVALVPLLTGARRALHALLAALTGFPPMPFGPCRLLPRHRCAAGLSHPPAAGPYFTYHHAASTLRRLPRPWFQFLRLCLGLAICTITSHRFGSSENMSARAPRLGLHDRLLVGTNEVVCLAFDHGPFGPRS